MFCSRIISGSSIELTKKPMKLRIALLNRFHMGPPPLRHPRLTTTGEGIEFYSTHRLTAQGAIDCPSTFGSSAVLPAIRPIGPAQWQLTEPPPRRASTAAGCASEAVR